MLKYTQSMLHSAPLTAGKIGVRAASREHSVDVTTLYKFMAVNNMPRLPVGNPTVYSPALKRRAIRIARTQGKRAAISATGLSYSYIKDLLCKRCRVYGFEGQKCLAELQEVGLEPHAPKMPEVAWAKNRAA